MALSREELDQFAAAGCQVPGCLHQHEGQLYLYGRCHPGGRIEVSYALHSGTLVIACKECGRMVAEVNVAKRASGPRSI